MKGKEVFMYDFCFMLKTYNKDYRYVERLIQSFRKYNKDSIHMFIVLPNKDIQLFSVFVSENISLIEEESIDVDIFLKGINGLPAGYLNQEIYKLAFWKLKLCKNYCCLDSECYFIRDFYITDFMYDCEIPYTVLIEDKELKANPQYYKYYWQYREKGIQRIAETIGFADRKILTCHGFQNLSCTVLEDFERSFLKVRGYTYRDIIEMSPYEFSWYNLWLQKRKTIPIYVCEPFFKTYHLRKQHISDFFSGITENDLARSYVGIVINGNFATSRKIISYSDVCLYNKYRDEDKLSLRYILILIKVLLWQPILWLKSVIRTIKVIYERK